jgi:hypothetical protein
MRMTHGYGHLLLRFHFTHNSDSEAVFGKKYDFLAGAVGESRKSTSLSLCSVRNAALRRP